MSLPSIGVANSISANFDFDPLDTINFAKRENFGSVQIYLNDDLVQNRSTLKKIQQQENNFEKFFYHAEGMLNPDFLDSEYQKLLYRFLEGSQHSNYILHFDENIEIDKLLSLVENLKMEEITLYIENFFSHKNKDNAEKNIKKYMALFTLTNNFHENILPVLDIPRLFHQNLCFTIDQALEWCYQLLNFFGNKNIPVLLHLIDCKEASQSRFSYCPIGEGYIPYQEIFDFLVKTAAPVSNIILEYEDKINPVVSVGYIEKFYKM